MMLSIEKIEEMFKRKDVRLLFFVSEESVQAVAERQIGRKLDDEELFKVSRGLEWGLGTDFDVVIKVAIEEALKKQTEVRCEEKG